MFVPDAKLFTMLVPSIRDDYSKAVETWSRKGFPPPVPRGVRHFRGPGESTPRSGRPKIPPSDH
jgi:hypothetical protein